MKTFEREILAEVIHLLGLKEFTRLQINQHMENEWDEMWEDFKIRAEAQRIS